MVGGVLLHSRVGQFLVQITGFIVFDVDLGVCHSVGFGSECRAVRMVSSSAR